MTHPSVFISYSHDSPEHTDRVLALANKLRGSGIDCTLDRYETSPPEGWTRWMERQLRKADFVLVICTETYNRRAIGDEEPGVGRGAKWEGYLIYQHIYNDETGNTRFIPVLFEEGEESHIPMPLQGATYYVVDTPSRYEALLRHLTGQPDVVKPPLGELPALPPRELRTDFLEGLADEGVVIIPAGEFLMGSQPEEGIPEYEMPQDEVYLPAYQIGKYPVTNEQYAEFIRRTGRPVAPEAGWVGLTPPTDKLDYPVAGVTWYDALAYCEWLSEQTGRQYSLPSEAQWEKAARGTDGRRYPWGDAWEDGRCNYGNHEIAQIDAYPAQSVNDCHDMVGNVREWTCSLWGRRMIEPDPEFVYPWDKTRTDRRNDLSAPRNFYRVYRGGAASDAKFQLRCSARNGFNPMKTGEPGKRHGFRVARDL